MSNKKRGPGADYISGATSLRGVFDGTDLVFKADITSGSAKELMKLNTNNRPLSRGKVAEWRNEIITGEWKRNVGNPITFSYEGVLLDGQHRLKAIAETPRIKVPVFIVIAGEGEAKSRIEIIDRGMSRKKAHDIGFDIAESCGIRDDRLAKAMESAITVELQRQLETDRISCREREMIRELALHLAKEHLEHAFLFKRRLPKGMFPGLSRKMLDWAIVMVMTENPEKGRDFIDRLTKPAKFDNKSSIETLAMLLAKHRRNMSAGSKLSELEMLGYICQAWRSFKRHGGGHEPNSLRVSDLSWGNLGVEILV